MSSSCNLFCFCFRLALTTRTTDHRHHHEWKMIAMIACSVGGGRGTDIYCLYPIRRKQHCDNIPTTQCDPFSKVSPFVPAKNNRHHHYQHQQWKIIYRFPCIEHSQGESLQRNQYCCCRSCHHSDCFNGHGRASTIQRQRKTSSQVHNKWESQVGIYYRWTNSVCWPK